MNLRTGLLQICAVLFALWILGALGVVDFSGGERFVAAPHAAAFASETLASRAAPALGATQTSEADRRYQAERRANRFKRFLVVAALVYVPPLVLLILGTLIAWIARHFRPA